MVVDNVSLGAEKDGRDGQKEGGEEVEPSCWCIFWGPRQSKINHSNSPHQVPPTENEKTNRSESQSLSNWTSKGEEELLSSSLLRKFSFNDLKVATRNFRPDSLLGEGGFGSVFKGWIDEHGTAPVKPGTGLTVAVKILNQSGLQGHQEWLAELNFLGQLSHPNLVKLFGYCIENDQRLLVYEFLQKGSLENHLFRRGAMPIPWSTRLNIALNAAKGLAFLHSGEKQPIIYRDFKSSNILLDSDFNAKLSDFGLARDGPAGDKSHVSTRVLGTYGYAAPEYVMTGHLTTKSDVYSYGVVLLELMTGKRCMDKRRPSGQHNLVGWVRPQLNDKKKLYKILDPGLEGQYTTKALKTLAYLAYRCTSRDTKSRPSMAEVVGILESLVETTKDLTNTNNINYPNVTHYPPSPLLGPRNGFNDTLSVVPEESDSTRPPYQQSIQRPSVDNTDK